MSLRTAITQAIRENRDIDYGASPGPCVRIGAHKLQAVLVVLDAAQICEPWATDIRALIDGERPMRSHLGLDET